MKTDTTERLAALRAAMHQHEVDAYVVPTADAHQSEYVAAADKRRAFISGFTGSAGLAVVTATEALLWTDGRYFLQASQELDNNWKLMKSATPGVPTVADWLAQTFGHTGRIGVDPFLFSKADSETYSKAKLALKFVQPNLIDIVWADRPAVVHAPAFVVPMSRAGMSTSDKVAAARKAMTEKKCGILVISASDEVSWLLNIRGADVDFNPVVNAFVVVTPDVVTLYADPASSSPVAQHLAENQVAVVDYTQIVPELKALAATLSPSTPNVWLDARQSSCALVNAVTPCAIIDAASPLQMLKGTKNETELAGIRNAHREDAAALIAYFAWLEAELRAGAVLDECTSADELEKLRSKRPGYVSLSFDTISATGANGAIIHYHAHRDTCAKLSLNELYLCDSGAQFLDGTTDVTRTLAFTTPTARQRDCYSRVLKGHVALARQIFPDNVCGYQLDTLARQALWQVGLDYRHGTGHGVGAFLNVHEGPHGVANRQSPATLLALKPGMVLSDEPGYYEDGAFGIRIENVMAVVAADPPNKFGDAKWLTFETVTLVPYDARLIDPSILSTEEEQWVNQYHERCLREVGPLLSGAALEWLQQRTRPLRVQCAEYQ